MPLLHLGTFDVANYGDLLYPLLLERRIRQQGLSVVHASPAGGFSVWPDSVSSMSLASLLHDQALSNGFTCEGVVVGGGNLIHFDPSPNYAPALASQAYANLWLGAKELAQRHRVPLAWNAPGIPRAFPPEHGDLVRWATADCNYLAVRDAASQRFFNSAGVASVNVVPDTAWDVPELWSEAELRRAFDEAFMARGQRPRERVFAVHMSSRYTTGSLSELADSVSAFAQRHQLFPLILALAPCHGDDRLARALGRRMSGECLVVDRPRSLRELVSCLARAEVYLGSSFHGWLTSCAFGRRAALVAGPVGRRPPKFEIAGTHELAPCVFATWTEALQSADQLLDTEPGPWAQFADVQRRQLAGHWSRLFRAIAGPRYDTVAKETWSSSEPFDWRQCVTDWQLQQVVQLTQRAARSRKQLQVERRLRADLRRRNRQFIATQATQAKRLSQRHEQEKATLLRERRQLVDWLRQTMAAVHTLTNSRRWHAATLLGSAWQRLRGRPRVFHAQEALEAVKTSFANWRPSSTDSAPISDRRAKSVATLSAADVEIVVCVHNALDDVRNCLASLEEHTPPETNCLLIDDASDAECHAELERFAKQRPGTSVLRLPTRQGYTRAANTGLTQASRPYVLLLNSDTIVTPGWLEGLLQCLASDSAIGMVGPVSNAATWQSVPRVIDADGNWSLNPLPAGMSYAEMSETVHSESRRAWPRVPLLNGFCLLIRRAMLAKIGRFDEQMFPDGYGEENDLCLRATAAGYDLAVADQVYVYHAKTRSYTPFKRQALTEVANQRLQEKYGTQRLSQATVLLRDEPELAHLRRRVQARLARPQGSRRPVLNRVGPRICFLLPVRGGGGGAHSVVLEAAEMRRWGAEVCVAIRREHQAEYDQQYEGLPQRERLFRSYESEETLTSWADDFDLVVGTIYHSLWLARRMQQRQPRLACAYYIQDYEPRFFPGHSAERARAQASYTLLAPLLCMAKTRWLCEEVARHHGVSVEKIEPSLDHRVYFPNPSRTQGPVIRVAAMIRPSTPRRGAERTCRVLAGLQREFGDRCELHTFGCADRELRANLPTIDGGHHGVLLREEVADLLRSVDVFLDLSDYQAFGRTALEAMACGCAVVVPSAGGCDEYAVDRSNCLVVDTSREADASAAARRLVASPELRRSISERAVTTAARYSLLRAATSEWGLFTRHLAVARQAQAA